jgi:hypothetical protein
VRVNVEAIVTLTGGLLPAPLARGHGGIMAALRQTMGRAMRPGPAIADRQRKADVGRAAS